MHTHPPALSPAAARGLLAAAGVAGALIFTGCGLLDGPPDNDPPCDAGEAGCAQADPTGDATTAAPADGVEGNTGGDAQPTPDTASSPVPSTAPTDSASDEEDWISTESLAGDESVHLDEDGSGKLPKNVLEVDIADLFVNKYDIDVDDVECTADAVMIAGHGSITCDIHTPDRTYYGMVIIDQDEGELFRYTLEFPGLDKDALDLS